MKKLILVCGPAGIGKSTYCAKYITEHTEENAHIVAADEIRREMCGSYKKFPKNMDMTPIYDKMIETATNLFNSSDDITIIVDTTMLYDERRLFFLDNLPAFDETLLVLLKAHDYSICLERNKQRIEEKWVPEEVIKSMSAAYEEPGKDVKEKVTELVTVYND